MNRASLLCLLLVTGLASSARAGDAIKVDLIPKAQKGQGQPELVVAALEPLAGLALDLKRSDGQAIKAKAGAMSGGKAHRFSLTMGAVGKARFTGTLTVHFKGGDPATMPIDVEAELLPQLVLVVDPADVDLEKHNLLISANRELAKAEVSLQSDTGAPLGSNEMALDGPDRDGKYRVEWNQFAGTVLKISVQGYDATGFFGGVDLFPWRVDIPHEEVNFKSGSADIEATETAKLDASWKLVQGAVQKYGKLATIKLYIAGHTDTVGDPGSNRSLSDNRAKSIGRWFKKKGLRIPVSYAGFGEDLLLVQTPDETDELKNRRAEYIVAVEGPAIKGKAVSWRSLD